MHPGRILAGRPRGRGQGALLWCATAAVLLSALWLGANRPVAWTGLSICLLGLFWLQTLRDLRRPAAGELWRDTRQIAVPFIAVLIWAMLQASPTPVAAWFHPAWADIGRSGTVSADPAASWQGVLRLAALGAAFWIAARAMRIPGRAQRLIEMIALFATLSAIYGIAAVALAHNPLTGPSAYPGMVTASFVNRNAYALYGGIGALACLAALAMRLPYHPEDRDPGALAEVLFGSGRLWSAGFLITLTAVVLSGSRAGVASVLLGVVVFVVLAFPARSGGWRLWAAVALILPVTIAAALSGPLLARLALFDPLTNKRAELYAHVIEGIAASPWRGHGLGAFQDAFRAYMPAGFSGAEWDFAHSTYLENAFELGIPGALALSVSLALIGFGLIRGLRARRRTRPAIAFAIGALAAAAGHATVDFSLQMPATGALLALILGMGWGLAARPPAVAPRAQFT